MHTPHSLKNSRDIILDLKFEGQILSIIGLKVWPWRYVIIGCDLDIGTHMVCWPCRGLPTMYIWSPYHILKGGKRYVKCLTFDLEYLTLRAKIQNSAAFRFCVWSFCTFLCIFNLIGREMREEFAKMWKISQKRYLPLWPWPWSSYGMLTLPRTTCHAHMIILSYH